MTCLIIAINCVHPIFLNFLVGYFARRLNVVSYKVYPAMNHFAFSILIPILVFCNIYHSDFSASFPISLMLYTICATIVTFIISYLIIPCFVSDCKRQSAHLQNAFRSNIGIIALSLAETMISSNSIGYFIIVVSVLTPIYNVLAILAFGIYNQQEIRLSAIVKRIIKNPILIGTIAGATFLLFRIKIPISIDSALGTLGKAGITLTLITMGAELRFSDFLLEKKSVIIGIFVRLFLVPGILTLCAVCLGFRDDNLATIMLIFAAPIATTAYSMARVYDSDYELIGQLVISESFLGCFSYLFWIFLLKSTSLI
ncbi:MAG TPA: hypothetical protein DIV40_10395 [Clostridiales bacterium]|jgi:hypothetical protein|nr:hypothetical protein [Clostridiales bacterium]